MRQLYRTETCSILLLLLPFALISLAAMLVSLGFINGFFLPSLPLQNAINGAGTSTTTTLSSSVYPNFTNNPKIQRALDKIIQELNDETLRRSKKRDDDEKLEKIEADLARARAFIKHSVNGSLHNHNASVQIYRNPQVFHRLNFINATRGIAPSLRLESYKLMEKLFKVFVYEEGEPPLFHNGPCKDIYSLEGIFLNLMEKNTHFRTQNPDNAHVYFLPFSVVKILEHLFDPITRDKAVLGRVIGDYVQIISAKYPFWNRSLGADHFILSCHDWGPRSTWYLKQLYFTSIRALCNANTSEFFNPKKDVSFPEINLPTGNTTAGEGGGYPPSNRTILAFFAGGLHGRIRPALFEHWKDRNDNDIKVYEKLPVADSYEETMKRSKYCLCPSGHEVASPRIVEAIYAECVPILISQNYILPFSDVLDWNSFSIQIEISDIKNLKDILLGISEEKYRRLQKGVKEVKPHFSVNDPPKPYDVFHMIIHSIWLRRMNIRIHG